jgi:hypothetical protein
MEVLGGEEAQLLIILNLGTNGGWVFSVTPRWWFSPKNRAPVRIIREVRWSPMPSGQRS